MGLRLAVNRKVGLTRDFAYTGVSSWSTLHARTAGLSAATLEYSRLCRGQRRLHCRSELHSQRCSPYFLCSAAVPLPGAWISVGRFSTNTSFRLSFSCVRGGLLRLC